MDKCLNDKIKLLISEKRITKNLCLLCLARLHEMIEYSNRSYRHLIPYRDAITKVLLENKIDREIIGEKIKTIHKSCYPTLNGSLHNGQIKSVYNMIVTGEYTFVEETIPEHYIKYKSEEEYTADIIRVSRKAKLDVEEKLLLEIMHYIEATFSEIPADKIKYEKIKALKTEQYTYEVILDALKAYTKEIKYSLRNKKGQNRGVFEYVLAIVKEKLPQHYHYMRQKEEKESTKEENKMIDFKNGTFFKLKPVNASTYANILTPMFVNGEQIIATFKGVRDGVVFTNKRIIAINVQGITGTKKDFSSLPYSKIQAFSVETAGVFDIDSELEIWFSGLGKVKFEFVSQANVSEICKMISERVL